MFGRPLSLTLAAVSLFSYMNESGCGVMEEGEDLTRSSPSHKRRLCENDEPAETVAMEEVEEEEVDEDAGIKKHCSIRAELSSPTLAGHDLNLPLPGDHGLPCLVKVSSYPGCKLGVTEPLP